MLVVARMIPTKVKERILFGALRQVNCEKSEIEQKENKVKRTLNYGGKEEN